MKFYGFNIARQRAGYRQYPAFWIGTAKEGGKVRGLAFYGPMRVRGFVVT